MKGCWFGPRGGASPFKSLSGSSPPPPPFPQGHENGFTMKDCIIIFQIDFRRQNNLEYPCKLPLAPFRYPI